MSAVGKRVKELSRSAARPPTATASTLAPPALPPQLHPTTMSSRHWAAGWTPAGATWRRPARRATGGGAAAERGAPRGAAAAASTPAPAAPDARPAWQSRAGAEGRQVEAAASVGATQASQPAPPSEAPPIQLPLVAACTQEAAAWAAVAAPAPAAGSAAGGRLQALQSRQSTPTAAPAIHRRGAASRARVAGGGTARPSRRGASARHRGRG